MKVVDLFSGAGGFSEGFAQAGFDVVLVVDYNEEALYSHMQNHPETDHLLAEIGHEKYGNDIIDIVRSYGPDVIIGSPPCPNFSVANTTNRDEEEGMVLVKEFYRIIQEVKPKYWIGENVVRAGQFIEKEIPVFGRVLNAADYGTPQKRKRYFFGKFPIPRPTHTEGAANHTLDHFFSDDVENGVLKSWLTIEDILEEDDVVSDMWMPFDELPKTAKVRVVDKYYQTKQARNNFYKLKFKDETPGVIPAHKDVANLLLVSGANSTSWAKKVWDTNETSQTITSDASSLFLVAAGNSSANGAMIQKLNNPGWTMTTRQNFYLSDNIKFRRFTIKELKRLMGFPDDYVIVGSKTAKIRQLGNAVCPPVSRALAEKILEVEKIQ